MQNEMNNLIEDIKTDYAAYKGRTYNAGSQLSADISDKMIAEFNESLSYKTGSKYIKITRERGGVWGFVVATDKDKKFAKGDILKAAGWRTPALNQARGNLFEDYSVAWTGPHYISGYSAGGTRKCGECGAPIKSLLK